MSDARDLDGQAAIVTGGGQGIGRAIVRVLAADGADMAIFDVNPKTADDVASEVRALGRRAMAVEVDVTDRAGVERAMRDVIEAFGRLDVLVNNVGWTPNEPFLGSAPETWDRIVALN